MQEEQAFDTTLSGITFPSSAQSDAQKVLRDDASVENLQGTLALNTSDVANYNQIFDTVILAQSTDTAALSALATDLGDTISTTTPTT